MIKTEQENQAWVAVVTHLQQCQETALIASLKVKHFRDEKQKAEEERRQALQALAEARQALSTFVRLKDPAEFEMM